MIIFLLITVFCLLPAFILYKLTQKSYAKGGRYDPLDPNLIDLLVVILPCINMLFVIVMAIMVVYGYIDINTTEFVKKFFRLK